jgi:hypothetical protein
MRVPSLVLVQALTVLAAQAAPLAAPAYPASGG